MLLLLTRFLHLFLITFISALVLSACASTHKSNNEFDIMAKIEMKSGKNLNPNLFNVPSPLYVTLYQLKDRGEFNHAEYTMLQGFPEQTLGNNLLTRQTILLLPNSNKSVAVKLNPNTHFIGLIASYSQLDAGRWRVLRPISSKTSFISIYFNEYTLTVEE